jgi:hypothetical protein
MQPARQLPLRGTPAPSGTTPSPSFSSPVDQPGSPQWQQAPRPAAAAPSLPHPQAVSPAAVSPAAAAAMAEATRLKEAGTAALQLRDFPRAVQLYTQGLNVLGGEALIAAGGGDGQSLWAACMLNIAHAQLQVRAFLSPPLSPFLFPAAPETSRTPPKQGCARSPQSLWLWHPHVGGVRYTRWLAV